MNTLWTLAREALGAIALLLRVERTKYEVYKAAVLRAEDYDLTDYGYYDPDLPRRVRADD